MPPLSFPAWARAIPNTPVGLAVEEFGLTPLTPMAGTLPDALQGSLYRNGPGQLSRGDRQVGHWFDGDGAILAVHFSGGNAQATYRFVQTQGYQAEAAAGQYLYGGYGMLPAGPYWQRFGQTPKNAANTSVLALPDKLLALWEGGAPHQLHLHTLETVGLDDLGELSPQQTYSAHPKRDPHTGEIFNFGVAYGMPSKLHLYRSDASGNIVQQGAIAIQGMPLVHDMVLAGPYLVFVIPAVHLSVLPLLTMLRSYSDSLTWQPKWGTQLVIVNRDTFEVVSRGETDPWFQWHFSNGHLNTDGAVVVDLIRYDDFQTNRYLKEVVNGQTQTTTRGTLWRLEMQPSTGKVLRCEQQCDRNSEFPTVNPQEVGQPFRYTYLSLTRRVDDPSQELFGAIARFDHTTGDLREADLGPNCYPSEPLYVPHPHHANQGWVLAVVFNGNSNRSEVWIWESDRLQADPVCRLPLPGIIPIGFHGTWRSV